MKREVEIRNPQSAIRNKLKQRNGQWRRMQETDIAAKRRKKHKKDADCEERSPATPHSKLERQGNRRGAMNAEKTQLPFDSQP